MEEDVLPNPPDLNLFGTERVIFQAYLVAQLVEKFFGGGVICLLWEYGFASIFVDNQLSEYSS